MTRIQITYQLGFLLLIYVLPVQQAQAQQYKSTGLTVKVEEVQEKDGRGWKKATYYQKNFKYRLKLRFENTHCKDQLLGCVYPHDAQIHNIALTLRIQPAIWERTGAKVEQLEKFYSSGNRMIEAQEFGIGWTGTFTFIGNKAAVNKVPVEIISIHEIFKEFKGTRLSVYPLP